MLSAMFAMMLSFCIPVESRTQEVRPRVIVSMVPISETEYTEMTPSFAVLQDNQPSFFAFEVSGDTILDLAVDGATRIIMTRDIRSRSNFFRLSVMYPQNMMNPVTFYVKRVGRQFILESNETTQVICR